jgi:phage gp36-like protein
MLYATCKDMIARFGEAELIQLTDREHVPPSCIDRRLVDTALADAQAEIDSHLAVRYQVSRIRNQTVPRLFVRLACDIARYRLHDDLAPENEVRRRYEAAVEMLKALAKGDILLGDALSSVVSGETGHGFSPRQVTDEALKGFL